MGAPATDFRPPDREAREAAADPRRQVVLRASAGTGKTTVLTARYLNLLECGVSPRNILALTFTRKAAAEMKDRIVARLAEPERRRRLAGRSDLAEVQVSTMDAFNLGLVREFPLDAGVSPGVEVLDERAMPVVRAEAIERVFSGAAGLDGDRLAALPLLVGRTRGGLRQAAGKYLDNRLTWRRRFEERADDPEVRDASPPPPLREEILGAEAGCRRILESEPGPPLPVRMALEEVLEPGSASGSAHRAAGAREALHRETLERSFRLDIEKPPPWLPGGLAADANAVREALRGHRTRWIAWRNARAFLPVWELFRAVEEEYRRLKEESGVMDFDDLTLTATRLLSGLGEFSESRLRLDSRYHHLLVDEFQDTSDAQWALLQALMRPWREGRGVTAERVRESTGGRLREPTLFVVGDHKQSIYRFRNARVEILGKAERWIESLAREKPAAPRIALRWNFRSVRRLRRFFNGASKQIAGEAREGAARDWAFRYEEDDCLPVDAGPMDREDDTERPVSVCVVEVPAGRGKGADDEAHREIAERVAARVASLLRRGAAPEEIALLARSGKRLGAYREAVERLGIPAHQLKGAGFFDTPELRDLAALCRFLARPQSDRRAVELLRSRFFAVPGDLLVRLKRAGGPPTPFADALRSGGHDLPPSLDPEAASAFREAGAAAAGFRRLARRLPPSGAVAAILETTRYAERASIGRDPHRAEQTAANLKKALQHLRAFERGGFPTMEGAARHLGALRDGDGTEAPVQVEGAVAVMTIHAAKGLEFDHVFLVDCSGSLGADRGIPRVQEGDDGKWKIALFRDAPFWKPQDAGRSDSEERRCMYVAMTRARRTLTLSWTARFTKKGALSKVGAPRYLPSDLVAAASRAARSPGPDDPDSPHTISWEGHALEVLPAASTETAAPAEGAAAASAG